LAAVDLDHDAMATEASRVDSHAGFAVEFVDRATWLTMRRLAATGLLLFTHEPRVLHRSAAIPQEAAATATLDTRAGEAMRQAERALRMAKVLAAGGFPEEAPDLIVKALQLVGGALMAVRGELPVGATTAVDADIRGLVERDALLPEALVVLDATRSTAPPDVNSLFSAAERVLAAVVRNEPRLGT
jgi:hypothetical protein